MQRSVQCCDCGIVAPSTNTAHTLISAQHGWRLSRERTRDGKSVTRWRCAECWARRKAQQPFSLSDNVKAAGSASQEHAAQAGQAFERVAATLRAPSGKPPRGE